MRGGVAARRGGVEGVRSKTVGEGSGAEVLISSPGPEKHKFARGRLGRAMGAMTFLPDGPSGPGKASLTFAFATDLPCVSSNASVASPLVFPSS